MKRTILTIFAFIVLLSLAAAAQAQTFSVYGIAYEQQSSGYYYAGNYQMKWCRTDNLSRCGYGSTDLYGNYGVTIPSTYGGGYYYCYLWKDSTYWGNESYPVGWAYLVDTPVGNNMNGSVISTPRALPPTAINPSNNSVNVGTTFTLQWTDGLDSARSSSSWPVTYDIYGDGNEYPETLEFSNISCGGVGTCSVAISGLDHTIRYQWRVVARMHSQAAITGAGDPTFYTSSSTLKFTTSWDPSIAVHNIRTYNGNYLRAPSDYSLAFDAAGTANNTSTQFQFDGSGTIYSGDSVSIRTNQNYHVSAVYGGGYGTNLMSWIGSYETFTITRLAGSGPIYPGDQVSLRSTYGYYVTAEGGGGGTVNANRTSVGPWETFTYY